MNGDPMDAYDCWNKICPCHHPTSAGEKMNHSKCCNICDDLAMPHSCPVCDVYSNAGEKGEKLVGGAYYQDDSAGTARKFEPKTDKESEIRLGWGGGKGIEPKTEEKGWEEEVFTNRWYTRLAFPELDMEKLWSDVAKLLASQRTEILGEVRGIVGGAIDGIQELGIGLESDVLLVHLKTQILAEIEKMK